MTHCYMAKNGHTIRVPKREAAAKLRQGYLFSTQEAYAKTRDRNWDSQILLTPTRQQLQDALE